MNIRHLMAIHGSIGSPSKTETTRRKTIRSINKDYNKALSVETFLKWELGELTDCNISLNVYKHEFSTVIGHKIEFTCNIDTCINTGSIVYDSEEGVYWLAEYVTKVDRVHKKGIMYRCNWMLKWIDDDGNTWEYPACDINSTQYNSGIDQGRNVDYVTSQHKLSTTSDINTNTLRIDKRFFLGKNTAVPDVYKLTQNDSSSQNYDQGLVSLTLLRDVYNEKTDDIERQLCDVYPEEKPQLSNGVSLEFTEPAVIRIGSKKTVKAVSQTTITDWQILENDIAEYVQLDPDLDGYRCCISIPVRDNILSIKDRYITLQFKSKDGVVGIQTFTIVVGGV